MTDYDDKQIYWWRLLEDEAEPDTRDKILFAAYKEIHVNGFQAASLNHILARTGVTKGALYHHFPNKTALGYAVIEEVIAKRILLSFISPLENAENPIEALIELIEQAGYSFSLADVQLGCPLGNLAQEMAPIDEGFRLRLDRIYQQWYDVIIRSFTRAQQAGVIIDEVDPQQAAVMIVATMEGCLNAGMISQDIDKLKCCGAGLIQYLNLIHKKEEKL
jgi:TetR/AcrR family transcriptional regulator, transcriptional repressor for nem operon